MPNELKQYLENKVRKYNRISFIALDPVSIPHQFKRKEDIEIAGLFAAVFAWGQRVTIINKCTDLLHRMDNAPHDFILNHTEQDLHKLIGFKHRTFNDSDLLYFVYFLHHWYKENKTLEKAFTLGMKKNDLTIENGLNHFRKVFFDSPHAPARTLKHIPSPLQRSACKRINMYLRWMVRKDDKGVDFGIWQHIQPSQLVCPLDLHVHKTALKLGLMKRTIADWQAATELTESLRTYDQKDPVKYDFALFGSSINDESI